MSSSRLVSARGVMTRNVVHQQQRVHAAVITPLHVVVHVLDSYMGR